MVKPLHLLGLLAAVLCLASCVEADPEFVHTDNRISALYCVSAQSVNQSVAGVIYENEENGYGQILVTVPSAQKKFIDITHCKLRAEIGLDAFVVPPLTGYQDISGDGIIVTVVQKSNRTTRSYRIIGVN